MVIFWFKHVISKVWEIFWCELYMSVGWKLAMLKIRSTSVTFLSLHDLEAAPEETMQVRRLIKSSNESLGPYLFGKIEFWNFLGPQSWDTRGGGSPRPLQYLKKPASNRVKELFFMLGTIKEICISSNLKGRPRIFII